jgi:hypothetical protein
MLHESLHLQPQSLLAPMSVPAEMHCPSPPDQKQAGPEMSSPCHQGQGKTSVARIIKAERSLACLIAV